MKLYVDNSRKEIYVTGKQDLREINRILVTFENMDTLEEYIVICGSTLPSNIEDTYDYSIDLDTDDKSINFA